MTNIDETYKAYLAGFLDGEGSVCLVNSRGRRFPRIALYQKGQLDFMTEIQQLYGGSLSLIRRSGVHQLNLERNDQILHFLEDVYPYLRFKKQKAEVLIAICKLRGCGQGQSQTFSDREVLLRSRYEDAFDQVNGA